MENTITHERGDSGSNAILAVLLAVVVLILGFLVFRAGLFGSNTTPNDTTGQDGTINVQLPNVPGTDTSGETGSQNSGGSSGGQNTESGQ